MLAAPAMIGAGCARALSALAASFLPAGRRMVHVSGAACSGATSSGKAAQRQDAPALHAAQADDRAASHAGASTQGDAAAAAAQFDAYPSRFSHYYRSILYRELMLKLQPRKWSGVPRLRSVTLTIHAKETHAEKDVAEKAELLLYLLALEHMAGKPAAFVAPASKHIADKAAGVTVTLQGDPMYNFMERLVYLVLPNQVGFEGVSEPVRVALDARKRGPRGSDGQELKLWSVDIAVQNLLLYPDFERNFNMFEPLRSMTVRLEVSAGSSNECAMLLSGLSLPLAKPPAPTAAG